jgi:hypothetical protein
MLSEGVPSFDNSRIRNTVCWILRTRRLLSAASAI